MKKRTDEHAGAQHDVRFRHPDGRVVDIPAMRWVLANRPKFTPRLGLSKFLGMLPYWLLKEVELDAKKPEAGIASQRSDPSSSIVLALEHFRLWVPKKNDAATENLAAFPEYVLQFQAACGLESLRRQGVLKVHVYGEDRLDQEAQRAIELNPAILAELHRMGDRDTGPDALLQRLAALTHLALKSDWADHEALRDDGPP